MKVRAFPLAAACLLAITSRTAGQDVGSLTESLVGLDGLQVIVWVPSDLVQEGGLTEDALQTYLEMRLRQAGIPVQLIDELTRQIYLQNRLRLAGKPGWSEDEWRRSKRRPELYLSVLGLRVAGGWAYTLDLHVHQRACIQGWPERKGNLMFPGGCSLFKTWDTGGLYITPDNLADSVRGSLAELMDELVNAYLTMNP